MRTSRDRDRPRSGEPRASRTERSAQKVARYAGGLLAVIGILAIAVSSVAGDAISSTLWLVEPLAVVGAAVALFGLLLVVAALATEARRGAHESDADIASRWSQLTQHYFDTLGHDMGRPLRRILGKARELRVRLEESGRAVDPAVAELLDEIEQQAPNFRLMMSNTQVLVELEDEGSQPHVAPVDPAQIIRNIVDRYSSIAGDREVEIAWWSEPSEFGVEYSDGGAIDHAVTNLVDNAVRFANRSVEVRLTRNPTHFFIRVWDDGNGIPSQYVPHIFERGWTPEVAGRQERTNSGLGLFIARTLALRSGGELTVESAADQGADRHTSFTLMLPRRAAGSRSDL